ncbi:hypothetical protein V8E53_001523 [Lactarius tabidus]
MFPSLDRKSTPKLIVFPPSPSLLLSLRTLLPSAIATAFCHSLLPSAIRCCHLPSAICHLLSAICHLPSAICHLPLTSRLVPRTGDVLLFSSAHNPNGHLGQLRRMANATFDSRGPPRRQRARSWSPPRAESSRKNRRSRSPLRGHNTPPDHLEKRARDNPRHTRQDKPEVFRSGAGPHGGVCVVCLGRHEHSFTKCDEPKLWDGTPNAVCKNEQGRLVALDGLPLCFDWQFRGCIYSSHPD